MEILSPNPSLFADVKAKSEPTAGHVTDSNVLSGQLPDSSVDHDTHGCLSYDFASHGGLARHKDTSPLRLLNAPFAPNES